MAEEIRAINFSFGQDATPVKLFADRAPYPMANPSEILTEDFFLVQDAEQTVINTLGSEGAAVSRLSREETQHLVTVCRTALPVMFPTLEEKNIDRIPLIPMVMAVRFFSIMSDATLNAANRSFAPDMIAAATTGAMNRSIGTNSSPTFVQPITAQAPKVGSKPVSARSSRVPAVLPQ